MRVMLYAAELNPFSIGQTQRLSCGGGGGGNWNKIVLDKTCKSCNKV